MTDGTPRTLILRGERIRSLASFYDEAQRVICGGWSGFGRNPDALVDILRGGFGVFEMGERVTIVWSNFHLSRKFDGKIMVLEILEEAENVEFIRENFARES